MQDGDSSRGNGNTSATSEKGSAPPVGDSPSGTSAPLPIDARPLQDQKGNDSSVASSGQHSSGESVGAETGPTPHQAVDGTTEVASNSGDLGQGIPNELGYKPEDNNNPTPTGTEQSPPAQTEPSTIGRSDGGNQPATLPKLGGGIKVHPSTALNPKRHLEHSGNIGNATTLSSELLEDVKRGQVEGKNSSGSIVQDVSENSKSKIPLLARIFPTQTIIFGFVAIIVAAGVGAISTIVPLNGRKQSIIKSLKNLGIDVVINGNVYFNPFVMAFEIRGVEATAKMVSGGNNTCVPSVTIRSDNVQAKVISKELSTVGGQIFVRTNGNMSQLGSFVSSMVASKNLSRASLVNSTLSVSPCDTGLATNGTANTTNNAVDNGEADGDGGSGALMTVPFKGIFVNNHGSKSEVNFNFTIEGEDILASYMNNGGVDFSFSVNSSFANAMLKYKLGDLRSKSDRVGSYSANILNGQKFARTLGFSRSTSYFSIVSGLTFRVSGDLGFEPDVGLVGKNELVTSYGNGAFNMAIPAASNQRLLLNFTFDRLNLPSNNASRESSFDTSAKYLGIPSMLLGALMSADHTLSLKINKLVGSTGQSTRVDLSYGMYKSILDLSKTKLLISGPSFEIKSSQDGDVGPSVSSSLGEQILTSAKQRSRSIIDTKSVLPLVASGVNVCDFADFVRVLAFGVDSGNTPSLDDPDVLQGAHSTCNSSHFTGGFKFFINYKDNIVGLEDIDISVGQNSGKSQKDQQRISGSYSISKVAGKNGTLEPYQEIDLHISGTDVGQIIPSNWIQKLFRPFRQDHGNSVVFNYSNYTASFPSYHAKITLDNAFYGSSRVANFLFDAEVTTSKFAINKLSGDSDLFKGDASIVFDISSKEPSVNLMANIEHLDLDTLLYGSSNDSGASTTTPLATAPTVVAKDLTSQSASGQVSQSAAGTVAETTPTSTAGVSSSVSMGPDSQATVTADQQPQGSTPQPNQPIQQPVPATNITPSLANSAVTDKPVATLGNTGVTANAPSPSQQIQPPSNTELGANLPKGDTFPVGVTSPPPIGIPGALKPNAEPNSSAANDSDLGSKPSAQILDSSPTIAPEYAKPPTTDAVQASGSSTLGGDGNNSQSDTENDQRSLDRGDSPKSDPNVPYIYRIRDLKRQIPFVENLFGVIKVDAGNIKFKGKNISKLSLTGDIASSYLIISKFFISDDVGTISVDGKIKLIEGIKASIKGKGVNFHIEPFVRSFIGGSKVSGRANFGFLFESSGRTYQDIISNLNGKVTFAGQKLSVYKPSIGVLSKVLLSSDSAKKADINRLLDQPDPTVFTAFSGKFDVQSGIVKANEIILKSVGYSGSSQCMFDISSGKIEICRSIFVLLASKPWSSNKTADSYIKVPFSFALMGNVKNPQSIASIDRISEYFSAVDQYHLVLQTSKSATQPSDN